MYSSIGKFEVRKLVAEFDGLLIQVFGCNMTDARITREEAIAAVMGAETVRSAVEQLGRSRGLKRSA